MFERNCAADRWELLLRAHGAGRAVREGESAASGHREPESAAGAKLTWPMNGRCGKGMAPSATVLGRILSRVCGSGEWPGARRRGAINQAVVGACSAGAQPGGPKVVLHAGEMLEAMMYVVLKQWRTAT